MGVSAVIGFSSAVIAQNKKSMEVTTLGEGEAIMFHPKGGVHKSTIKVTAAQHEAALKQGAREIKPTAVVYKQAGKLYMLMLEDNANEKASEDFQNNFDTTGRGLNY